MQGLPKDCKSLIQHIKKKASCGAQYADDEMEELRIQAKLVSEDNARSWKYWNKDKVKSSNVKYYEQNKEKKAAYYQSNKEKIAQRKAEHHSKNYSSIAQRKSSHYFENKEKRHEANVMEVEKSSNSDLPKPSTTANYSLKRKPIDFSMAELEAATENDGDEDFKANVEEPLEKKTLPKRKCSHSPLTYE